MFKGLKKKAMDVWHGRHNDKGSNENKAETCEGTDVDLAWENKNVSEHHCRSDNKGENEGVNQDNKTAHNADHKSQKKPEENEDKSANLIVTKDNFGETADNMNTNSESMNTNSENKSAEQEKMSEDKLKTENVNKHNNTGVTTENTDSETDKESENKDNSCIHNGGTVDSPQTDQTMDNDDKMHLNEGYKHVKKIDGEPLEENSQHGGIIKEDVNLPNIHDAGKLAFVLYNVFTKEECDAYIKATEKMGYEIALLNVGGGRQIQDTSVRNSSRCIWDSVEESNILWERIKPYIPETFKGKKVIGLNERLRFLRYDPGEYFKPHFDGSFVRDNGEISQITVHLYLNEGFEGGSTTFIGGKQKRAECVPKTGSILIFQHNLYHEGSLLKKGRKYTVRTDVMYR